MTRKRFYSTCVILGIILLFAAYGKEEENTEKTEQQKVTTLDWYINLAWFQGSWGENIVSKQITKDTGVAVNFIAPAGNESEKLSALISSDSLPDMITLGWWEPELNEMIDGGKIYPLNELADKYDKAFWEIADEDVVSRYKMEETLLYQNMILMRLEQVTFLSRISLQICIKLLKDRCGLS